MQKLLLNMHIFMHSKICKKISVKKTEHLKTIIQQNKTSAYKCVQSTIYKFIPIAHLNKCKFNKIISKNVILILERVPT